MQRRASILYVVLLFTDQPVSDTDIQNIVDIFDLSYLDDVYTHLGLGYTDVKNAKLAAQRPLSKDQAIKVLNELWLEVSGAEATKEKMIEAMKKCPNYTRQTGQLIEMWGIVGRLKTFL